MNPSPSRSVAPIRPLDLTARAGARLGTAETGLSWLTGLAVIELGSQPFTGELAQEEAALLVLSGTHDFEAGGKAWPQRGVRQTPMQGRPIALYLPPRTPFSVRNGRGEALLVRAQLPLPTGPAQGIEELARKPLLVLAGSGKAFDPTTGGWRPEEEFLDSPEFLLPRHIHSVEQDGVKVERIFSRGYKSRVLGLAEAVLPTGRRLTGFAETAAEAILYYRSEGPLTVEVGTGPLAVTGEGALAIADASVLELRAGSTPAYVALATAAPKSST